MALKNKHFSFITLFLPIITLTLACSPFFILPKDNSLQYLKLNYFIDDIEIVDQRAAIDSLDLKVPFFSKPFKLIENNTPLKQSHKDTLKAVLNRFGSQDALLCKAIIYIEIAKKSVYPTMRGEEYYCDAKVKLELISKEGKLNSWASGNYVLKGNNMSLKKHEQFYIIALKNTLTQCLKEIKKY